MNCFTNNTPNISASERTRDRRARTIFKSTRMDFQERGDCSNFTGKIGFYKDSGELRYTRSYDKLRTLARGYALCMDGLKEVIPSGYDLGGGSDKYPPFCFYIGLAACSRRRSWVLDKAKMVSGRDSVYNLFNGTNFNFTGTLSAVASLMEKMIPVGFPVIKTFPPPNVSCINGIYNFDPLGPFRDFDGSFNILNYPDGNTGGCGVIIDPSNILFGTNACPDQVSNRTVGPNKYLTFAGVSSIVRLEGQLFSPSGQPMSCHNYKDIIRPGLVAVGGMGLSTGGFVCPLPSCKPAAAEIGPSAETKAITWRQWFAENYTTAWGVVERACCGTGPAGEKDWWTVFVKVYAGGIVAQCRLPMKVTLSGGGDVSSTIASLDGGAGSVGSPNFAIGGFWETGSFSAELLLSNLGSNLGGGGVAFYDGLTGQVAVCENETNLVASMGWSVANPVKPPWEFGLVGAPPLCPPAPPDVVPWDQLWTRQPYIVGEMAGSCDKNLLAGNNTKQNYLVSYDPVAKGMRFTWPHSTHN